MRSSWLSCVVVRSSWLSCVVVRSSWLSCVVVRNSQLSCVVVRSSRLSCVVVQNSVLPSRFFSDEKAARCFLETPHAFYGDFCIRFLQRMASTARRKVPTIIKYHRT